MIIKKLHVFGWPALLTSGFSGNLALFKCSILSYLLSLLSDIFLNIFSFFFRSQFWPELDLAALARMDAGPGTKSGTSLLVDVSVNR